MAQSARSRFRPGDGAKPGPSGNSDTPAQAGFQASASGHPPFRDDRAALGTMESPLRMGSADPLGAMLADMLHQVNDWLKFAEGKNAGIVGLASGGSLALMATVPARAQEGWGIRAGFAAATVFLAFSLFAELASFMPRTNLARLLVRPAGPPSLEDNLLFYGHLARYVPIDLAKAVARRYCGGQKGDVGNLHVDLAAQIATNARITVGKLRLFSYAVALFAAALALLMASVVAWTFV